MIALRIRREYRLSKFRIMENQAASIAWTTNVMAKYKEMAEQDDVPLDAHFSLELYEGFWTKTDIEMETATEAWHAPEVHELVNATGFLIPGEYLTVISNQLTPSYTVRISTSHPADPTTILSTLAYIIVKAEPATVQLDKSVDLFVTDDVGQFNVTWVMRNFDVNKQSDFELKITKNGSTLNDSLITFDNATQMFIRHDSAKAPMVSKDGGAYSLVIDRVDEQAKRIKDIYAITLAVKSGLESTWSYDSMYLQVYRSDALQIQVDGQSKTEHRLSNIERIMAMDNDERVALNRDINLKNTININNNQFTDLSEVSDQIIWESSNNHSGVIYFNSNGIMADIERFHYESYQPKHHFLLAGLENGQTKITAIHARTGMTAELDVTIETLQDKLYLFQFYPKAETTIIYTNNMGDEKTATSNGHGELALFEEHGIASDVYVTSEFNNSTYTGVISHETLLSKEKNPTMMELYPINILQLRELSKVEIFFKTTDGEPYVGKVTYRGGVYKNNHYCEAAEISGLGKTEQWDAMDDLRLFLIRQISILRN